MEGSSSTKLPTQAGANEGRTLRDRNARLLPDLEMPDVDMSDWANDVDTTMFPPVPPRLRLEPHFGPTAIPSSHDSAGTPHLLPHLSPRLSPVTPPQTQTETETLDLLLTQPLPPQHPHASHYSSSPPTSSTMALPGQESTPRTTVIQWILDTRSLWPNAARTADLAQHASRAFAVLPPKDRVDVLKYVHVKDAKMALGSRLVKRYLISRYADSVSWDDAVTTRNKDTKPVFIAEDGSEPIVFNVSHQAGLVVLAAAVRPQEGAALGVDVVCPGERRDRDHALINTEGWEQFVAIHEEVLCPAEVTSLNRLPFRDLDHRLRYFYTLWCLREAYVKMTGEALLAPWLKSLEMKYFTPPEDAPIDQTEIWFQGRRLEGVDLHMENVLDEYMICTSTKRDRQGGQLDVGQYELLDIDKVLDFAEESSSASV